MTSDIVLVEPRGLDILATIRVVILHANVVIKLALYKQFVGMIIYTTAFNHSRILFFVKIISASGRIIPSNGPLPLF